MTAPTDTAVAELAARLTKAECRALVKAWRTPAGRLAVAETCSVNALVALEIRGLADEAICLTPLGLAVRAYLLEHPHAK